MGCHAVIIQSRIKMNQALAWIVTSVGQGTHGREPWLCKQWCVSAQKHITVTHVNFRSWGYLTMVLQQPQLRSASRAADIAALGHVESAHLISRCFQDAGCDSHICYLLRGSQLHHPTLVRSSDFGGDRWWHHREYQKKPTTRHNWLPRMWFSEPNRRQHLEDDLETVKGLLLWVSGFGGMHVNAW